ncbi:MAG: hypothetical protein HOQ47_11900, partial [Streptomyces sp.]|nr:hypothetical protein [Streptomyces sp.]
MRLTRATLAVASLALSSAVLAAAPSFAAAPSTSTSAAATVGVVTVADSPYDGLDETELRAAVAEKLALPYAGKRVKEEAGQLLDSGTVEEMRAWLDSGYRLAQEEDDNVAIAGKLA